jgi:AcrR family transcriptional regulator
MVSANTTTDDTDLPPKPVMGRPRSADINDRILRETLDVVSEKGFSGVTINEICVRAGVSRATFYRRFPNPSAAVAEAINAAFEFHELPRNSDPVEYLLEFALAMERTYSDGHVTPAIGFMIGEINAKPDVFERVQQGVRERRAHVRHAVEAMGALDDQTGPPLDLDVVLVILSGLASDAAVTRRPLKPDILRSVITRLIV